MVQISFWFGFDSNYKWMEGHCALAFDVSEGDGGCSKMWWFTLPFEFYCILIAGAVLHWKSLYAFYSKSRMVS